MQGYHQQDYSGGWNNNHDQRLRQQIDMVFQRHDNNQSGQLEGPEFFNAYRDLCLSMGMAPPQSQQEVIMAAQQCDTNHDGRVSKMEMFNMFKRIQGIQGGGMGGGMGMGGGYGQGY
jgi:Ca2+-binding EF-hand superfamily protein